MVAPPVRVTACGCTDAGLVRDTNEDSFALGDLGLGVACGAGEVLDAHSPRGALLVVCDGMGGANGGEVASALASDTVWCEMLGSQATDERAVYARLLRRAIRAAHRRVLAEAKLRPELTGMGTTVSAAGVAGGTLLLAQVGDSRAYIERGPVLTQVTRDQSVVSALVHAGRLSPVEARLSDQRSLILQALGTGPDVDVALSVVELRRGDRLLLCSDGLHGAVSDEAVRYTLGRHVEVDAAAAALIALARQAGAPDNVTVVVARFDGEGLVPAALGEVPRFAELDPNEEGERAVTTTSHVARRLAARAGLRGEAFPAVVPATGQHEVFDEAELLAGGRKRSLRRSRQADRRPLGPAQQALLQGAQVRGVVWVVAVVAALVFLALLLYSR